MNGQDPLAQLRDIHLPEALGWWPPAPLWWLLLGGLLLALAGLAWLVARARRRNAFRRQALRELDDLRRRWDSDGNTLAYRQGVNALLKRTALYCYPDQIIAPLAGKAWAEFLDTRWRRQPAAGFAEAALLDTIYRPVTDDRDSEAVHRLVSNWIRQQRGTA